MTAQTAVFTESRKEGISKVSIDWSSTEAGVVVGAVSSKKYTGALIKFDAIPDPSSTTPTAAYTFTVKDGNGADLLAGLGVGSATATATVSKVFGDGLGVAFDTYLTFAGAGMGDAKGGILNLYFA